MKTPSSDCGGILWRIDPNHHSQPRPIRSPRELDGDKNPLLFIHGVEYESVDEALKDLVNPILDSLRRERIKSKSIYVFSWNSLIVPREKSAAFLRASTIDRIKLALSEAPKSPIYLADIERRAREAASVLSSFVTEWNSQNKVGPMVITHSMGSLVWVEAMKKILESSSMLSRPGVWWSLQPALLRQSLSEKGDYHMVSKLYTGHESAKAMIWYSRMDFILSSLYLVSKPGLALGQWGCPENSLPQRDVTKIAREAHGMNHLVRIRGDFFRRVNHLLPIEASRLGII